jgi:hypothetical protein
MVIVLAEGPIQSIDKILFNGEVVAIGPMNSQLGGDIAPFIQDNTASTKRNWTTAVSGRYRLGGYDQTAFGLLVDVTKDLKDGTGKAVGWTAAHRLAGTAALYLRLKYNRDLFSGIPEIQVDLSGKLLADVTNLSAPKRYSTNPADVLYDYLVRGTNTKYSKQIEPTLIDTASFITAARYCNEIETGIGNRRRYEINGHIDTSETLFNNTKRILANFNAMLVFSNGVYKLVINKPESPTGFVFNEENITGKIDMNLGSKETRLNRIKANFFNPALDWQQDVYDTSNTEYFRYDGKTELVRDIDLMMLADRQRVGYLAQIILNQSRYALSMSFQSTPEALRVEVGQIVEVQHQFLFAGDTTPKLFRVMGLKLNANTTVDVTLQQYDAEIYSITPVPAKPVVGRVPVPSPNMAVAPVGPLNVTARTEIQKDGTVRNSLYIAWSAAPTSDVRNYEITVINKTANTSQILTTVNLDISFTDVIDKNSYGVEVRTVSSAGYRSSPLIY